MSIEDRREKNKQDQQKIVRSFRTKPGIIRRDPVTGNYESNSVNRGKEYKRKNYTGDGDPERITHDSFEGKNATKQNRKRGIEGYKKGQIFNNPAEQTESTKYEKIKYVYSVLEDGQEVFYVGGHQPDPVKIGVMPGEIGEFNFIYINNLGGNKFTLDIVGSDKIASYDGGTKKYTFVSPPFNPLSNITQTYLYGWRGRGFWSREATSFDNSSLPPRQNYTTPPVSFSTPYGSSIINQGVKTVWGRIDYIYNNQSIQGEPYLRGDTEESVSDSFNYFFSRQSKRFFQFRPNKRLTVDDFTNILSSSGDGNVTTWQESLTDSYYDLNRYIFPEMEDPTMTAFLGVKGERTSNSSLTRYGDRTPSYSYSSQITEQVIFETTNFSKVLASKTETETDNTYTGPPDYTVVENGFYDFESAIFQLSRSNTVYFYSKSGYFVDLDAIKRINSTLKNSESNTIDWEFEKYNFDTFPVIQTRKSVFFNSQVKRFVGDPVKVKIHVAPQLRDKSVFRIYHESYHPK